MNYSTGRGSPHTGKTFQVRDLCWWTVLIIWGCKGEESRLVAFIITIVIIFVK